MQISQLLANRILRDVANHQLASELVIPASLSELPCEVPVAPATKPVAVVRRGHRRYDVLLETTETAVALQAFYLNYLRLSGWELCQSVRAQPRTPFGLTRGRELKASSIRFFCSQQKLVLEYQPVEESPEKTTILLSIDDAGNDPALRVSECSAPINWVPAPVLLPPVGSERHDGIAGGGDTQFTEVRILESGQSAADVFKHYQRQIDGLSWESKDSEASADFSYGLWEVCDRTNRSWQLFLSVAGSKTDHSYSVVLAVNEILERRYPTRPEVGTEVSAKLVERLLKAKEPGIELYIGVMPGQLESALRLPASAQVVASLEREPTQRRYLLDMKGTAANVYGEVVEHFCSEGWVHIQPSWDKDGRGFVGSGFCVLVPSIFQHPNQPDHRLRLLTRPGRGETVQVELLLDFDPAKPFYSPEQIGRITDSGHQGYPVPRLMPPSEGIAYASGVSIGRWHWGSTAVLMGKHNSHEWMEHYASQLVESGWGLLISTQRDRPIQVSSWSISTESNQLWRGLLWVIALPDYPHGYRVSFEALTENPSMR